MRTYLWVMAAALTAGCATSNAPSTRAPEPVAIAAPAAASPAPAAQPARTPDNNSPESRARKMGYRVVHRDGNSFFCKDVAKLGTHIAQTVCITPAEFELVEQQAQQDRDNMRQKVLMCAGNTGTCGAGGG